jgi:hypothetical protein
VPELTRPFLTARWEDLVMLNRVCPRELWRTAGAAAIATTVCQVAPRATCDRSRIMAKPCTR